MKIKAIMKDMIEAEISKLEQSGEKVKFKTLAKKRILYTVIFGAIFLMYLAINSLFLAFIDMLIYFIVMYNTNNASVITALAKKTPDKPITEIIKGDMK